MPKKSVAARAGAQRQKARTQKSFELVRSEAKVRDDEALQADELEVVPAAGEERSAAVETTTPRQPERKVEKPERVAKLASTSTPAHTVDTVEPETTATSKSESSTPATITPKVSASTRMAVRRQAAQRNQQRNAASLITAEHFSYVRRDLVIIATLAVLMFAAIIVLYFVFGRGA